MPVPLMQAIVVVLAAAVIALVTRLALRSARGARRIAHWLALWLSLAPPIGLGVWLVNRTRDPGLARAALLAQGAGAVMWVILWNMGAGEG